MILNPRNRAAETNSKLLRIIKRLEPLGLLRDPRCCRLLHHLYANPNDDELLEILNETITTAELKQAISSDLFRSTNPCQREIPPGSLHIGRVLHTGAIFSIDPDVLTNHMLVVSRPGGGKTNLALLICSQLIGMGIPVIIPDRKIDYYALTDLKDFRYLRNEDRYTNYLEPAPTDQFYRWIPTFAQIIAPDVDIRIRSRTYLTRMALELYEKKSTATTGVYPTIEDLYEYIDKQKYPWASSMQRSKETCLGALDSMRVVFGNNISSNRKGNWNTIANTSWSSSLDGIPTDSQNVDISILVAKILRFRMLNNIRSKKLSLVFLIDEASTIFRKYYETQDGTYLLLDYLAKSREFGVAFIICSQTISGVADSVLALTGIKVLIGGCGLGSDYDEFARATGLNPEQSQYLRQITEPGIACIKHPNIAHPFTVEVPCVTQ